MKKQKLFNALLVFVPVSLFYSACPVNASQGDIFYVTGSVVNIRAKATTESEIVTRASRGSAVEEIDRESGWVYVKIKDTNQTGWIHTALLNYRKPEILQNETPATAVKLQETKQQPEMAIPESKTEEQKVSLAGDFSVLFEKFRSNRQYKGQSLFSNADERGDGIVYINAMKEWADLPAEQREQDLKELFDMWSSTRKGTYSAVYIVDQGESIPAGIYIRDKNGKIQHAIRK